MELVVESNNIVLRPMADIVSSRVKEMVDNAKEFLETHNKVNEVILDLHHVKIIDSIGITFVVGLYKSTAVKGKTFKITGMNTDIRQLFKIMRLDEIFVIED